MKNEIELKDTTETDFDCLFSFQLDKEANYLAAFTSKDPTDKIAYIEKWTRLLSDKTVNSKTIFLKSKIVGSIAKFEMEGKSEITYWIGKEYWGKGIASNALQQFLKTEKNRPIYGRVAFNNFGSQKVLEKCEFKKTGTKIGFANSRETEIEEIIYRLK